MGEIDEPRVPYPGLRPFEADEVDLFFGREQQVDALLKRLSNSHFVAVVGESGAGKSSLVRAGLLPALEAGFVVQAGSDWRVALMRPGGNPLTALASALLAPDVLGDTVVPTSVEYALAELRRGPFGLVQLVRDAHLSEYSNLLLVVDQFEELFRYCREPEQKDQANIFVELLLEATAQRQVSVSVVLTMRSDFIGDCARFRGLPEKLNDNQFLTPRLTRDQIAEAIRGPARVCGGSVEQDLVDELCNAVGDNQDQLPLLQHLLMRVWERASKQSDPPRLTPQVAKEMGGLYGALSKHAQQLYDSLPGESERAIARVMFKSLTDPFSQRRDVRRDALVSEIAAVADAPVPTVIADADHFRGTGVHMLMPPPTVRLNADSRLDISHESLIRQWSALSTWADEEAASAREFERLYGEAQRQQRDMGDLLSGRSLAQAAEWFDQAKPTPAWVRRYATEDALTLTRTFVERSVTEETRRKEIELQNAAKEASAQRVRKYNWALGALAVMAIALAVWSVRLSRQADKNATDANIQRVQAIKQEQLATTESTRATKLATEVVDSNNELGQELSRVHSILLASHATEEVRNDPSLAVLLARRAVLEPNLDERAVLAIRTSIASHVPNDVLPLRPVAKLKNYLERRGKKQWLEYSLSPSSLSSQRNLAIVPSGKDAIVWSTGPEKFAERRLRGHKELVGSAIFSPDGRLAVTTSADKTACVWDVVAGRQLRCVGHDGLINGAVFSPDGRIFVTLSDDMSAKVWSVDGFKLRCAPLVHDGEVASASFSADGKRLVTLEHNQVARVWDVGATSCGKVTVPFFEENADLRLRSASYSPDGQWLGLVTLDGRVHVLDAARWMVVETVDLARGDAEPPPLAWSSDSRCFAVAGGDNVVHLYSIEREETGAARPQVACRGELRGHTGRITSISFNPRQDGTGMPREDRVVTTSEDRTARLWRLGADRRLLEGLVLRGHKDIVGSAVFVPPGDDLITASEDGSLRRWKPLSTLREQTPGSPQNASLFADGRKISAPQRSPNAQLSGKNGPCVVQAVSRDGDRLVWYCPDDDKIALTTVAASKSVATKPVEQGVEKLVQRMLFSHDGRILAVTFDDFSAQILDSATLKVLATMIGHTGSIAWTDFSRDDRFLTTLSRSDSTARVWDVASGELIARIDVPNRRLTEVAFGSDDLSLLLQASDGLLVWRCYGCGTLKTILAEIRRRQVSRLLSDEEMKRYGITSEELNSELAETSDHHR